MLISAGASMPLLLPQALRRTGRRGIVDAMKIGFIGLGNMGAGMAVLRSKDPEGVAQEMWALFAVYQAIHTLIGAAVDAAGIPPEKISFPHALAAATDTVTAGFPPSGS